MIKGPLAAMIFKKGEKMFYTKPSKGDKLAEEALMRNPTYVKTVKMKNKIVDLFSPTNHS